MATRPAAFDLRGAAPTDGDTAVSGGGQRRHGSELKSPNPIREKGQKKGKWRGREQVGVLVRTLTTRERRQRGMAPASLEAWRQCAMATVEGKNISRKSPRPLSNQTANWSLTAFSNLFEVPGPFYKLQKNSSRPQLTFRCPTKIGEVK